MTTWYSQIMFLFPSSQNMKIVTMMNDMILMILLSITLTIVIMFMEIFLSKYFNSYFMENHQMEMIWTVIPFLILVFIMVPSVNSLYMMESCLFCGVNLKILGHQWYWSYFYNDLFSMMNSYMLNNSVINLMETDNNLIIPNSIPINISLTSEDVIHSWTVPSLGVKMDAIPGRINQTCLLSEKVGTFFGQCSEICGANHSFMPIVLESISPKFYIEKI